MDLNLSIAFSVTEFCISIILMESSIRMYEIEIYLTTTALLILCYVEC